MDTLAPSPHGPWLIAEALARCDRAGERLDRSIAMLQAIDADCTWQARIVEFLHHELDAQQRALAAARGELRFVESALRAGSVVPVG